VAPTIPGISLSFKEETSGLLSKETKGQEKKTKSKKGKGRRLNAEKTGRRTRKDLSQHEKDDGDRRYGENLLGVNLKPKKSPEKGNLSKVRNRKKRKEGT